MKKTPPRCINCSEGVFVLNQEYDLYYNNKKVGFVQLSKNGMYYLLKCRFHLDRPGKYHLFARCGNEERDLGTCVPYGRELGIERCLPIKKIGEGQLLFTVAEAEENDLFVPVSADHPFPQLDRLVDGCFAVRCGVKGIVFRKTD